MSIPNLGLSNRKEENLPPEKLSQKRRSWQTWKQQFDKKSPVTKVVRQCSGSIKENEKPWVCIDFTYLDKAFPKDSFPLQTINIRVNVIAWHDMLSFLDAYSGCNQILMHEDEQENTSFMTEKEIYCCKVTSFRLKNARATYQRLVNKMLKYGSAKLWRCILTKYWSNMFELKTIWSIWNRLSTLSKCTWWNWPK